MGNPRSTSTQPIPERRSRVKSGNMACIFVHAGAGFHSMENEHIHLKACNDAASAAMAILKAGGAAVDAIEIAIKILEDREITNAGYGSNLAIDGTVECDAIIVDHNSRSGGVGAVAQIKNPISLARLLLDKSAKPLSLRRVPPNFLVGQGATDFAFEHGFRIMQHDVLISPAARDRWLRWREELRAAQAKPSEKESLNISNWLVRYDDEQDPLLLQAEQEQTRRAHLKVMEQGLYNEAQPMTPPASDMRSSSPLRLDLSTDHGYDGGISCSASRKHDDSAALSETSIQPGSIMTGGSQMESSGMQASDETGSLDINDATRTDSKHPATQDNQGPSPSQFPSTEGSTSTPKSDHITDTVGAIAVDIYGHVACGASSGGIGMKHRGRVGPAALVGVGASILPVDPNDVDRTCVASVTSGTGEHMATTMAAATCCSRLFYGQRKSDNTKFEDVSDEEAIRGFIEKEFVGHPSVQRSTTAGSIGVLSIKMTKDGAWMYFAHNTESFALSSMCSTDRYPVATMSRKGQGDIAQGGRGIRFPARRPR